MEDNTVTNSPDSIMLQLSHLIEPNRTTDMLAVGYSGAPTYPFTSEEISSQFSNLDELFNCSGLHS